MPALILTSEAGSFAHNTLKARIPAILDETLALNAFSPEVVGRLAALRREITAGVRSRLLLIPAGWSTAVVESSRRAWMTRNHRRVPLIISVLKPPTAPTAPRSAP